MNFNNYTIKSQEALQKAQQIAYGFGQQQIENAHLLKGILEVDENVTPFILNKAGINLDVFKQTLESIVKSYPKAQGGEIMLSKNANNTLLEAEKIAKDMKD